MMEYTEEYKNKVIAELDKAFENVTLPWERYPLEGREAEEKERKERAKNLIVFHFIEQIGDSETIRNAMDHKQITEILAHENKIDLSKMKVKRLGKYDPENLRGSRPLLIMFNTAMEAQLAYWNGSKFPPGAVVKRDRTPYQRLHTFF